MMRAARLKWMTLGLALAAATAAAAPAMAGPRRDDGLWKAAEAVRPAQLKLLETLVNIDSGTGDIEGGKRVLDILAPRLEAMGATVERVPAEIPGLPDNLVATLKGKGQARILMPTSPWATCPVPSPLPRPRPWLDGLPGVGGHWTAWNCGATPSASGIPSSFGCPTDPQAERRHGPSPCCSLGAPDACHGQLLPARPESAPPLLDPHQQTRIRSCRRPNIKISEDLRYVSVPVW